MFRAIDGESRIVPMSRPHRVQGDMARVVPGIAVPAMCIPHDAFEKLVSTSACFRVFVFDTCSKTFADLVRRTDRTAPESMDSKIAGRLLRIAADRKSATSPLHMVAGALDISREVLLRRLVEFERRDLICQINGEIRLVDLERLSRLAKAGQSAPS